MKLRELKNILDRMSDEELEQDLIYNSEEYSISGLVGSFEKQKKNLYYTGGDDPAQLYTKKELLVEGYDLEDVLEWEPEIPKGAYVINI